jgi:cobalamin biosynthesis protein CobD/CbiB
MNNLEEKLRNALRRESAPEGFAERVLARARSLPQPETRAWRRFGARLSRPAFRWALAAVAVCLMIAAGVVHHQRQERLRREGEMARAQVRQALRIASVKLNVARRKVLEIKRTAPSSRL